MSQAVRCLMLLIVIALLFVTELIPLAITAMGGAIACGILGFIPVKAVFAGLSNSTVVLFAGMFVVGAAMFYTGLAQKVGNVVVKLSGTSENSLMFGIMLVGALLSSVLSNTGTAACLLPVVLGICAAAKIPASRQLMPLAFACGLGGIITMVGTPPNIIANGALQAAGYTNTFGFFEYAWIGIPLTVAGILYMMFIGKHLLPKVELDANQEIEQEVEANEGSVKKQWISGAILLVVVLVMALGNKIGLKGIVTLEMAAIIGAMVSVLSGCLTERQAYSSIDWVTIFLFAGMMPVSSAMDKTGAGKLIAEWTVGLMGGSPSPIMVTAILFILSC
ncbi:MAG: SLC13 family permease [Acidaminococcaceae bacterium]|nr:SLC13 family permease [Acidaminococcaceae bacterium]